MLRINVLERYGEVDQEEINVPKSPCIVLGFGHLQSMFGPMIVVPQLGGNEDVLSLHQAIFDCALDTLACFGLVLVIVCSVEETISNVDRLSLSVSLSCLAFFVRAYIIYCICCFVC